jgi:alkylation response protein AidB-like acyl-CoA dehydrogenase
MDFNDTPEEAAFRAEARAWLTANAPAFELPAGGHIEDAEEVRIGRAWQRRKYDGGYAGILLPKALGGRGGTIMEAVVFGEEEGRYRVPKGAYTGIGLGMALPTIIKHGTPEQIARFVEPTLRGELTWCQLFSEPAAGSDLAGLRTKAVRDGGEWVVNGQKVWSSWAHLTDWGVLIARSDPGVPKHKGLTFFVVDMRTPGVEVRPIRQISGLSDFNETFLTDVRIPDANRVGAPGEGWACAMTLLTSERLGQGGEGKDRGIVDLIHYAAATPRGRGTALDSGAVRLALAAAYAEEQAEKHFQARLRTMISRGENPGASAAIVKLAYTNRYQKLSGLAMELREMSGIAHEPADKATPDIWYDYIWSTALRVAGGADEVLRNQISERVLNMPGEIRTDKNVPFDTL